MNTNSGFLLRIRTPEGIVFSYTLASPISRGLALAIDLACISALSTISSQVFQFLVVLSPGLATALNIVIYFILSIGYSAFCEWKFQGQTLGKRLLKLQVIDEAGLRLQFSQVMLRNLIRTIDLLPMFYLVGGLFCLVSPRCQRLGDLVARTVVIRLREQEPPNLDKVLPDKFNSFLAYPHVAARIRHEVSPRESELALQALLRREDLEPMARIELFSKLATHFRSIVPVPEEATNDITDEQYVRNVVHLIFYKDREKSILTTPPRLR